MSKKRENGSALEAMLCYDGDGYLCEPVEGMVVVLEDGGVVRQLYPPPDGTVHSDMPRRLAAALHAEAERTMRSVGQESTDPVQCARYDMGSL